MCMLIHCVIMEEAAKTQVGLFVFLYLSQWTGTFTELTVTLEQACGLLMIIKDLTRAHCVYDL